MSPDLSNVKAPRPPRKAQAQERRVVPETIARFMGEGAARASMTFKPVLRFHHTFDPGRTPPRLRHHEREPDWRLPALAEKYPRFSTDRDTAEENNFEWVTPGHPLFEALRRHVFAAAQEPFKKGACFYSLQHESPSRIDFYRARVVDGLGRIIHERMFAVELAEGGDCELREPAVLSNFIPAELPAELPSVAMLPEAASWLHEQRLQGFLEEVRAERLVEIQRITDHTAATATGSMSLPTAQPTRPYRTLSGIRRDWNGTRSRKWRITICPSMQ